MKISIIKGDITKLKADAIVNAAHHTLMGGELMGQFTGPQARNCLKNA